MRNILKSRVLNDNDCGSRERNMQKADMAWLDSITKRQKLVISDLIEFADSYPEYIDREMVGSFICLYELLADTAESVRQKEIRNLRMSEFYR